MAGTVPSLCPHPSSSGFRKTFLEKTAGLGQAPAPERGAGIKPLGEGAGMEYRRLGGSGFKVPVLSLGTGTFGGGNDFFKAWGSSDVAEATRLVDICLDAGLTMFDSADAYSGGQAEEILGQAIKGRRDRVIISTKATFRAGPGPNDVGSSRFHLTKSVEASLRRLGTDYIDLF